MNFLNWFACHILNSHSPDNYESMITTEFVRGKLTKGEVRVFKGQCRYCGLLHFASYSMDLDKL